MKTSALTILASAVLASAQATYNSSTGQFVCAKPDVNYCGSGSLESDIIIRCDSTGLGQTGRCSDNLAGQPPLGNTPALCWQTSETSGDAACEKNCVVYASTSTFTLDASLCTPTYTASSTSTSSSKASSTTPASSIVSSHNGTVTSTSKSSASSVTSTSTSPGVVVTAGAAANNAGSFIAGAGLLAAYLL